MKYAKYISVLIVEDEYITASFLEDILYKFNVTKVIIAGKYNEAMELVKKECVDVVFMDINLQDSKSGIECAKEINRHFNLPIVYITAYNDTETIQMASDTNMYGYICKPFDKKDIQIILNVLINQLLKDKKDNLIELDSDYIYNLKEATLTYNGNIINLTKKESLVLKELVLNRNQNVTHDDIRLAAWDSYDVSESALRDTILRIRKKANELNIQSNIGFGYTLKV